MPDYDDASTVEPDFAAAVSLSSLSGLNVPAAVGNWSHQIQNLPYISVDGQQNGAIAPIYPPPFNAADALEHGEAQIQADRDLGGFDHFREFANFLEGVGLPAEWSPYLNGPDRPQDQTPGNQHSRAVSATPDPSLSQGTRLGTPFSCWLPSAPATNGHRITSYAQEHSKQHIPLLASSRSICMLNQTPPVPNRNKANPGADIFRVDDAQRNGLTAMLDEFRDAVGPGFVLPSRHALTRYITSFFEGFHSHMNFIHVPSWSVSTTPLELLLAIATVGAQYCFEHKVSKKLFFAAKAILLDRITYKFENFGPKIQALVEMRRPPGGSLAPSWTSADSHTSAVAWDPIDAIRTLIMLMGFATWEPQEVLLREAFVLQSLLAQVCRDVGLDEPAVAEEQHETLATAPTQASWLCWSKQESVRRAKLIAFSFMHIHSVAYNVYPALRSNEVHLRLPCSTREWRASSADQWGKARAETPKQQLNFQEALSLLLRNVDEAAPPLDPIPTPLGNYLLLHGLLQRIYIVRDLSLPLMDQGASLPQDEVEKLERALRSWTSGWQQASESSLDPNNENGPIPFTSSALLGLAYVRIYLNLGPYRALETRDSTLIAESLLKCPGVSRSKGVVSALLYAAHSLSIPVRLGVDRVARSQAFFWSVRHSLSGLECAVLLSRWLFSLDENGREHMTGKSEPSTRHTSEKYLLTCPFYSPTESEQRILHWVSCVVEEAWAVVDFDNDEGDDLDPTKKPSATVLGLAVLKIWSHFFKSNTQWPFINIIGDSLEKFRSLLVARHQMPT